MHLDFQWQTACAFSKLCIPQAPQKRDNESLREPHSNQLIAPAATDCDRLGKPSSQAVPSSVLLQQLCAGLKDPSGQPYKKLCTYHHRGCVEESNHIKRVTVQGGSPCGISYCKGQLGQAESTARADLSPEGEPEMAVASSQWCWEPNRPLAISHIGVRLLMRDVLRSRSPESSRIPRP